MIGDRSCMHALPRLDAATLNLLGWGCPSSLHQGRLYAGESLRYARGHSLQRMLSPFTFKFTSLPRVVLLHDSRKDMSMR